MSWLSGTQLNSLDDLFLDQIKDLYDAEQRLTQALPKMEEAAHEPSLKKAFRNHLRETEGQIRRLEQVFISLGQPAKGRTCDAMKGLLEEAQGAIDAEGSPEVKDAALVAAAQRIEHYEIAAYGTARTFARRLGNQNAARLLEQTLDEEKSSDQRLSQVAESSINEMAATV